MAVNGANILAALGAEGEIVRGPGGSAGLVTFCVWMSITAVKGERRGGVRRRARADNRRFITGEFIWVAISPSFGKAENAVRYKYIMQMILHGISLHAESGTQG